MSGILWEMLMLVLVGDTSWSGQCRMCGQRAIVTVDSFDEKTGKFTLKEQCEFVHTFYNYLTAEEAWGILVQLKQNL